jgi:hypothetical protein
VFEEGLGAGEHQGKPSGGIERLRNDFVAIQRRTQRPNCSSCQQYSGTRGGSARVTVVGTGRA